MNVALIKELYGTLFWQMDRVQYSHYRNLILSNIANKVPVEITREEKPNRFMSVKSDFQSKAVSGNALYIDSEDLSEDDVVINVLRISGPITRQGGECAYGSKDYRNILIKAANKKQVIGHILVVDSPGGSSSAMADFQEAFDYIRNKKQQLFSLIDGDAASLACGLVCMTNKVYFRSKSNGIGSIGTYCSFFSLKDGATNSVTQEQYHERYADKSKDKNGWYRKAVEGDYSELDKELKDVNDEFIKTIKSYRKSVTEEQLSGKMFKASDVIGTLVDGQSTLEDLVVSMYEEHLKSKPSAGKSSVSKSNHQITSQMKNSENLRSFMGFEALERDKENGTYLNEELADKAEDVTSKAIAEKAANAAKIEELNSTIESMKTSHEKELKDLKESHANDVSNLNDTHSKEIESLNDAHSKEIESLKTTHKEETETLNTSHSKALGDLQEKITSLEKENTDLKADITELKNDPTNVSAGPMPGHNNEQAAPKVASAYQYDSNLSMAENAKLREEFYKSQK